MANSIALNFENFTVITNELSRNCYDVAMMRLVFCRYGWLSCNIELLDYVNRALQISGYKLPYDRVW